VNNRKFSNNFWKISILGYLTENFRIIFGKFRSLAIWPKIFENFSKNFDRYRFISIFIGQRPIKLTETKQISISFQKTWPIRRIRYEPFRKISQHPGLDNICKIFKLDQHTYGGSLVTFLVAQWKDDLNGDLRLKLKCANNAPRLTVLSESNPERLKEVSHLRTSIQTQVGVYLSWWHHSVSR